MVPAFTPGMVYYPPMPAQMAMDEKSLLQAIRRQVEYYFSKDNLVKDTYLRSKMDSDTGFVPISFLATFKRLASLTQDPGMCWLRFGDACSCSPSPSPYPPPP